MMGSPYYVLLPSAFGIFAVIWRDAAYGSPGLASLLHGHG